MRYSLLVIFFIVGCGTGSVSPTYTSTAIDITNAYVETNLPYNFQDVIQGAVGDCWLVSSIVALALNDQNALNTVVNSDGQKYKINIFVGSKWASTVVDSIDVENSIENGGSMWGDAIEQGVANLNSVLHFLDGESGDSGITDNVPSAAFTMLTSLKSTRVVASDPSLWYSLLDKNGTPCVADTLSNPSESYIIGSHTYTVIASGLYKGVEAVMLRNPWKSNPVGGIGTPELQHVGVIVVDLQTFKKNFTDIEWVE